MKRNQATMKKLFIITFICFNANFLFSQGLLDKWTKGGDVLSSGDWFGSSNFESIFFRTNNITKFCITASGDIVFPLLNGTSNGFAVLDNSGKIVRINFSGNPSDVFFGNGAFGSLSAATGWFTSSGITFTNNKVGIGGISSPIEALEVNGSGVFNGNLSAQALFIGDVVNSGKQLRISNSLCMKGFDLTIPGSRSEICGMGHDFYIQSTNGLNNHTILNYSNGGNVGIGTNTPLYKLEVAGSTKISGDLSVIGETFYSGKTHIFRLSPMPGDSLIRIGDSTIISGTNNRLYPDYFTWTSTTPIKGIGFGHQGSYGFGEYSLAMGTVVRTYGNNSIGLGHSVTTALGTSKSIVIGSGISPANLFKNDVSNSLMIGFGSDIPTLFIGPASGIGTIGKIGFGTKSPFGDFEFLKPTGVDLYVTSSSTNLSRIWVKNDVLAYTFGINSAGMGQIGDGITSVINFMHGNVGIGTTCLPYGHPYKLTVEGEIAARGIWVKNTPWCDYVFKSDYKLLSYKALGDFINVFGHLPNVPSQEEIIKEDGYSLNEMSKIHMEKIEESTLYILDLNTRVEKLEKENAELKDLLKQFLDKK